MNEKDIKSTLQKYQPQLDKEYQKNIQIAKYTNLSDIEKSNFLQHSGIQQNHICFLFDGKKSENFEDMRILYFMINVMDSKIEQNCYTMVYLMNDENGRQELIRFLKILKRLPMKYYLRLKQFYIYQASLMVKTKLYFQRSKRCRLWKKFIKHIEEVEELLNVQNFSPQWINLIPKKLDIQNIQQFDQLKIQKPSQGPYGMHLEEQKLNQFGIPIILDHLLSYFVINADRFLRPDIFRKQGSIDEETQLFDLLNAEQYESLNVVEDVKIVCTMIKRFFTSLPEPLIPNPLLQMICNLIPKLTQQLELQFLDDIFGKLPQKNRILLSLMASFLLTVGNYAEFNHMNMNNLAIVFAPCFLRVQTPDISSLEQIGLTVKFLRILFENFDKMFPEFTFKLFLTSKMGQTGSSTSSNSSTGTESKTQMLSSSEDEIVSDLQQQKQQI